MNTVWRDIRVHTWGRSVSLEGRLWIITELVMCSFGLFISGPLSVMRVIILSCCSHYVTHRCRCVYLSILFPRCTSAFLLSGLAWWEGLHQDRWKRDFFYRVKKWEPFWRFLLLNLSTTSGMNQKRCRLDVCTAPTLTFALSQRNPVFFSYDTISRQPWQQNPAVVAMRQVITSSFTLGFLQEGWSCLLWLRDVLPQQRRRRSICRVIKPLQYWIISTPEQLAGTWIFHGEFGLHKSCNKQIHCHICGDWLYIVILQAQEWGCKEE